LTCLLRALESIPASGSAFPSASVISVMVCSFCGF
jgi:hypothetical protein